LRSAGAVAAREGRGWRGSDAERTWSQQESGRFSDGEPDLSADVVAARGKRGPSPRRGSRYKSGVHGRAFLLSLTMLERGHGQAAGERAEQKALRAE